MVLVHNIVRVLIFVVLKAMHMYSMYLKFVYVDKNLYSYNQLKEWVVDKVYKCFLIVIL